MKKILIAGILSTSLIVLTWGGLALAQGHGHGTAPGAFAGHGPFHGWSAGAGPMHFLATAFHARASMVELVHDLELDEEQRQHLERIHTLMRDGFQERAAARHAHLEALVGRVEEGRLDPDVARATVDARVEVLRTDLYVVADELVALVNSFDDRQREIFQAHLEQALDTAEAVHGHGPDAH